MNTTKSEIAEQYDVVNGVIRSPGKFEGEPEYAPYFYDLSLNGGPDEEVYWPSDDEGEMELAADIFKVNSDDIEKFPQLDGIHTLSLKYDSQGFVICQTWNCSVQDTILNIRDWMGV